MKVVLDPRNCVQQLLAHQLGLRRTYAPALIMGMGVPRKAAMWECFCTSSRMAAYGETPLLRVQLCRAGPSAQRGHRWLLETARRGTGGGAWGGDGRGRWTRWAGRRAYRQPNGN